MGKAGQCNDAEVKDFGRREENRDGNQMYLERCTTARGAVIVSGDPVGTSVLSLEMEFGQRSPARCDTGRIVMKDAANNRAQSEMWAEPLVDHSSFFSVTKIPSNIPRCVSLFLD